MKSRAAEAARVVHRLAVLLEAGVHPVSAWTHVDPAIGLVAGRGASVAATLAERDEAWKGVGAAWAVATSTGAPLAPTLRRFAVSLRELAAVDREIANALAGPVASTRMVSGLPLVGLVLSSVMGFDTVRVLVSTPPGLACLAAGLGLLLGAVLWNRRLVAAARPPLGIPALRLELMAIAVSGGSSIDRAHKAVNSAVAEVRMDVAADAVVVDEVLDLSRRAGAPAAELLVAEAEEARREFAAQAVSRAHVLSVRLMLPLGLCILPAFMLLSVAPLLISIVSSTIGGLE